MPLITLFVLHPLSAGPSAVAVRIGMVIDAVLRAFGLLGLSRSTVSQCALLVELSRQVLLAELRTRLHYLLSAARFDRFRKADLHVERLDHWNQYPGFK